MTIIAQTDTYTVASKPGTLIITRAADGKVATIKGQGLAAQFKKHVANFDGQVNRVTDVFIETEGRSLVWQ